LIFISEAALLKHHVMFEVILIFIISLGGFVNARLLAILNQWPFSQLAPRPLTVWCYLNG